MRLQIPSRILPLLALLAPLAVVFLLARPAATYSQSDVRYFPETQHTVRGKFLSYWDNHGGLAQQGYPLTEEFQEKNKLNGQTYTVQYFERSIFELHPENQPPFDVLLSQLGTFELGSRYPNNSNPAAAPVTDPDPNRSNTVSVAIQNFAFVPATINIAKGAKIIWTNQDTTIHTVAAKDTSWSSDILNKGDTYSRVFDTAGTFTVICSIHPDMVSTVVVK